MKIPRRRKLLILKKTTKIAVFYDDPVSDSLSLW